MASSIGKMALGFLGAALLAPFGFGAVGFALGSALGGALFAPDGPTVEGPRLGDTDVTASSLGKIIPRHYGVTRSAGNVIWSGGLKEIKKTEEVGGKGGGGQENVTYQYLASFACSFGYGPAKNVLRMWADGKIIYDTTGGNGSSANSAPTFNFRFKSGGIGEGIDPLIQESINRRLAGMKDVNAGNGPQSDFQSIDDLINEAATSGDARSEIYTSYLTTLKNEAETIGGSPPDYRFTPSYKELCYIVFDDMPLADFGNRIPNITAEIAWTTDAEILPADTLGVSVISEISTDTTEPPNSLGADKYTQSLLFQGTTKLRKFSASSSTEVFDRDLSQTLTAVSSDPAKADKTVTSTVTKVLAADGNGDFFVSLDRAGDVTTPTMGKVANASLDILGGANPGNWDTFYTDTLPTAARTATYAASCGKNGSRTLMLGCNASGELYIYDVTDTETKVVWGGGLSSPIFDLLFTVAFDFGLQGFTGFGDGVMVPGPTKQGESTVYWLSADSTDWALFNIEVKFGKTGAPTVNIVTMATGDASVNTPTSLVYDEATEGLLVLLSTPTGGLIQQYDPDAAGTSGDPYLQYESALTLSPPPMGSGLSRSSTSSSFLGYANGTDLALINTSDGTEKVYIDALDSAVSDTVQVFVGYASSLYTWIDGQPSIVRFSRLSGGLYSTDLATIITDVCTRAGMQEDEFSVDEIIGQHTVRGYTIARNTSGRKALEPLLMAYFVDGIETDGKVTFKTRTNTPVRTVTEDELGIIKGPTGDVSLLESRQPEYDLPSELSVVYTDQDRDYQQGSAHYKRTSNPSPTMYSKKTETAELPMVLLAHEARDITQKLMFTAWMSRDTAQIRLPWTHIDLDPSDVIELQLNDGRTLTNRVGKVTVGANFELEAYSGRSGDPVFEAAELSTVNTASVPSNTIYTPVYSKLFVLDIPLVMDYHDMGGTSSRYYSVVGSDSTEFSSADIYASIDGNTFANIDTATADATWGQIIGDPLGSPRALWTTDKENSLTVSLSVDNGDINSVTLDELVNGVNMAVVWNASTGVGELIQYQDVTVNADGTVTLSTLIRGRRGTDWAVDSHVAGEFFIALTDATLLPEVNTLAQVGSTQYFKAVSRGSLVGNALTTTTEFAGNDLKPYAPSNVKRTDDGTDLTITWNRRTRIGGEWNMTGSGIETLGLNEDTEAYEVFVLPNTTTALELFDPTDADTYESRISTTVEAYTIPAADLSTFGYTLSDPMNIVVYQMSAQVGRGFPRKVSLPA